MVLKWIFDRVVSFIGIVCLCWIFPIVAILIKIKMPGGPVLFCQKRVGKDGKLFTCHKFRSMTVAPKVNSNENDNEDKKAFGHENDNENEKTLDKKAVGNENSNGWSTVSVAGDSRITPFGAKLRHYKIDELPELWDVLIGNMSFVGPRPDVPGYADQLQGDDRKVLKLRPGITGPATLKYRLEDEMIAEFVRKVRLNENENENDNEKAFGNENENEGAGGNENENENFVLPENVREMTDQELAVWYNDNIIYPDKVRLNKYYYEHYSFVKDIQMIFATVLGFKVDFAGERI